jgi:hypothetical protein
LLSRYTFGVRGQDRCNQFNISAMIGATRAKGAAAQRQRFANTGTTEPSQTKFQHLDKNRSPI